ncbi:MAG: CHASE2 domain-containing protein [Desulfobacterales bacterium]|nr:CHASE2 domain-containing protein [Desulfobacterales bacterium]
MAAFIKKYVKLSPLTIAALTIILGLAAYTVKVPFLELMELRTIDLRFQSRGEIPPGPEVVLAVVDEKSIAVEGNWVWPRKKFAHLINRLSDAGAKVIGFDVGFLEPDNKRLIHALDQIKTSLADFKIQNSEFQNYLEKITLESDNDRLLAEAIKKSKAKVVLGYFFQMDDREIEHITEKDIQTHAENVQGAKYAFVQYASEGARNLPFLAGKVPQSNIREIATAAGDAGFFNMFTETDGVVRWLPAVLKFRDNLYAPLSLKVMSAFWNQPLSVKIADYGVEKVRIGRVQIPTDEIGRIMINYRGKQKIFPHISITDILQGKVSDEILKNKIVFVGATATGIYDLRNTPFESVYPGLEIHANIVDSIFSKDFLQKPGWVALFDMMAIVLCGLLLGFLLPRGGVILGTGTGFTAFVLYIVLCQYLFSSYGWILNLVYPLIVILMAYTGITAYRYFSESRQKAFIRSAFSTYLAPSVVKQLIESPEKLVLGGENREITAFFSDLEGFTSISEKLTAPALVELLNEYLTEMTEIILDLEGTVDKFEGDAIIALFGAPNDLENHAERACIACVEMQNILARRRVELKAAGKPELKMRIGLCTGSAVVGNMGSKNRMDYTMMGDTVNTAARLEGVNKVYGIYTLISETTYKACGDRIMTRQIDSINVVGKKEAVNIYEIMGYINEVDARTRETVDQYAKGRYAYRERQWDEAINYFNAALAASPDDGPSKTFISRCNEFKSDPPGKDWDGAYTMKTK